MISTILFIIALNAHAAWALNVGRQPSSPSLPSTEPSTRRGFFSNAAKLAVAAATPLIAEPASVLSVEEDQAASPSVEAAVTRTSREQLLEAIGRGATDEQVIEIIHGLQDPAQGQGAIYPDRLDGQWELIWSYKAEAFSPLLKLPKPFKPDSYQYFGSIADQEVGSGRIAQGLTGGVLGTNHLWLSSGAIPLKDQDPSVLEIQPPFRLQLGGRAGTGQAKTTLVDSGSDADFRAVNARTKEAQEAGKNWYQQMYLENEGPGSLRVSGVIAGDPVLVGELFVHRKL